ncbi:cher family protein [Megaselia abdita]
MEAERDLAEDAQWKKIQQNTFTRWANEHLKSIDRSVSNLETDLCDGLRLIALIEVLSQKRLPKHNKRPTFRSQKLENISVALKFLEDEGIKIVNIDSSDIVDCKLKLILGLIWTLILHYSISMPMWEGEDENQLNGSGTTSTPKQRLLNWIQSRIPDAPVNNFTTDWTSGKAVGALVDACAPGLCPDWELWNPKDAVQNASEAMGLADDYLNVRQLIKPEELVNPNVDEQSMMTYLSQYPNAKLKPGAPLRPKTNPNSIPPPRVRAYGPGIEPIGLVVGAPANFTVETFSAGKGNVEVQVLDPQGNSENAEVRFNNDKNLTYTAAYIPKCEGAHKVVVKYASRDIPKSPFNVNVEGHAGDASKVNVQGPGIHSNGVFINKPTFFDILTKEAGLGVPEVVIIDPANHKTSVPVKLRQVEKDIWRCEYVTPLTGMHSVNVFYAGTAIPKSPFAVKVSPLSDARKVRASGRGLQESGVRVKDDADFKIYTDGAGDGVPEVKVIGPGGVNQKVMLSRVDGTTYEALYYPTKEGRYVIAVSFGGQEISKSPFEVKVGPHKESSIVAYGPGLRGGIEGYPASFFVETNGETGALGFTISGPSQAEIECHDNGDGSALVKYFPTAIGEYAVHILCDNEDIPKSPHIVPILPKSDFHPQKVKITGQGIEKHGVTIDKPTTFTVDTSDAGNANFEVVVQDAFGDKIPVHVTDGVKANSKVVTYTPRSPHPHCVEVNYGNVATGNSPYRVYIGVPLDATKVRVLGPWFEPGVKPNIATHFNVDTREAGNGELTLKLLHEDSNAEVPVRVIDHEDNTYTAEVIPPTTGTYILHMTYGGSKVPGSHKVTVTTPIDISKVKVDGLEPSVIMNSPTDFTVDMSKVGSNVDSGKFSCAILDPKGHILPSKIEPEHNSDVFRILYTPFEAGRHTIDLLYDNVPVPGSPFVVNVKSGCDPTRCKAYGKGLERGITNKINRFTVDTKEAGKGGLSLFIEGPTEVIVKCTDNRDGTCDVEYQANEPGEYDVIIKFAEQHIPGSPFLVVVDESTEPSKVKVYGPGIEHGEVREGVPTYINIDVSEAGPGRIAVKMTNNEGIAVKDLNVEDKGNGIYAVHYVPPKEGTVLTCQVKFADNEVPCSPFVMNVFPKTESKNVKVIDSENVHTVPASLPAKIELDAKKAGQGDIDVDIKNPKGKLLPAKAEENGNGKYSVSFVPDEIGPYNVSIKFGGKDIEGSPFVIKAHETGEAKKCKIVQDIPKVQTSGSKRNLSVDARDAGDGAVTCNVTDNKKGSDIDIEVIEKDGFFDIFYTLSEAGDYDINMKFGGNDIPNGSFTVKAVESVEEFSSTKLTKSSYIKQSTKLVQSTTTEQVSEHSQLSNGKDLLDSSSLRYRSVVLEKLPLPSTGGNVVAEVKMPSGKVDKPVIEDNRDGTVSIKYDPKEEGVHELVVKYNGEQVQGSPYKFHVDSIASGHVTAYGEGLVHGISGEPSNFTISTKGAGAGGLSLAVEGPSKADINYHDNKDGTVSVTYLPTAPGEYKISVRFGDKHIKGSPYFAKVTGEGRKRNQISVGSSSEVTLPGQINDADLRTLNAFIQTPSGLEEPCFLKRMPSGNIGISFTPRETGEHQVSVRRQGKHIPNSPFKVVVGEREVGDAKKVKVTGKTLQEGKTHTENTFSVDTRNAGYGGLSLSIEGPSKAEIVCNDKDDGTLNISYKPTEPGYYIVNMKFADHHVEGSPFTVKVIGEGSNRQREKIQRQREAVPLTEVGSQCKLTFKMPGITSFDLAACVTSPSNITEDAEIQEIEDGLYSVHFVPKELGVHTVSVRYNHMHIPGSPFQFTVGPLRDFGSHLVKAGGTGLERGEVGFPAEFNVWTREAGGGSLAISVEGPSKAEIEFKDRKDGSCDVSYKVSEPGEYRIGLKFNDRHIPDSPYKVYITPAVGDAHKMEVQQFPQGNIQADAPSQFIVRTNGAKGEIDAKIVAPSGAEDDCFIQKIDAEMYSVRFYPRENGIHAIHVKLSGVHIPGSPYKIKVGKDVADPAAVHASGMGLEDVKTGQKADFIINTCNSGVGTLSVTIDGPSKVALDCTEVEEGYKVRYTPLLPGDYYASIKYNNMHIVGSPYKISCTGDKIADEGSQETSTVIVETVSKVAKGGKNVGVHMPTFKSDASKVTSKGMGLKKAYMGKQNQFTLSAADAGNNILYIGIYGPKGPCDEVLVKHTGRNNYSVNYLVRDRGEYILIIKWGDDHIPGSPFKIDV